MCFDLVSSPPIPHIHGGSVEHRDLTLVASDETEFAAFEAVVGSGPAIVVLPDVRGLFSFYEELALRLAEHGTDAIAIDYFGRTAGVGKRDADFDFWPHVDATTLDGVRADVTAAIDHVRSKDPTRPVFVLGFCFGGSNSWYMAAAGLNLAGAIGFYGHPDREGFPKGAPTVMSLIPGFSCPVLALQGGDDPGIPVAVDTAYADAITAHGKDGEVIVYEGAPHSFFDRKSEEFAEASADAWDRIQRFLAEHG
jgi:carboxymethylenebutenolidase